MAFPNNVHPLNASHCATTHFISFHPRMMQLKKDDGGLLYSDAFLRDVCINFILAGRDTSSALLTWFFWLLTWHPDVERKIVEEVDAIVAARPTGMMERSILFDGWHKIFG